MRLALTLARRGLGNVWPNPSVGCVIVNGDRVVGRGWTQPNGRPHAERVALDQAGAAAKGATAYVTLEPCSHHGKTPPCADALIAAGITRVVAALEDPDPRVSGDGFRALREAGIHVDVGCCQDEAFELNLGFLLQRTLGRPMVTLKLAATLDGKIATAAGESRWITGSQSRRMVHHMRAEHDAIMIGSGTAIADDPRLDIRLDGLRQRAPVRVVADSALSLSLTSQLAVTAQEQPVWLCHRHDVDQSRLKAWQSTSAELIEVGGGSSLSPSDMLQKLGQRGITRVLCEGGAGLAASLLSENLVDRLVLFSAGKAMGSEGVPVIGPLGVSQLSLAPLFTLLSTRQIGEDAVSVWAPIAR